MVREGCSVVEQVVIRDPIIETHSAKPADPYADFLLTALGTWSGPSIYFMQFTYTMSLPKTPYSAPQSGRYLHCTPSLAL